MATLKEHQAAMVGLLANGSGIPASASRLAHAMHDVLEIVNNMPFVRPVVECGEGGLPERPFLKRTDATTPGLNDKALADDIEFLSPKPSGTPAERRVKELENTIRQLKANLAEVRADRGRWMLAYSELERLGVKADEHEQAGCRKEDTQECEHEWRDTGIVIPNVRCSKCGVHQK